MTVPKVVAVVNCPAVIYGETREPFFSPIIDDCPQRNCDRHSYCIYASALLRYAPVSSFTIELTP